VGGSWSKASLGKSMRPYLKIPKAIRTEAMAEMVKCLLRKHKALVSKPQYHKRSEKNRICTEYIQIFLSLFLK
jgi:hypothetical protein